MVTQFHKFQQVKDKDDNLVIKIPNLWIDLPYTYLMTWFVLHSLELMTSFQRLVDHATLMCNALIIASRMEST